eukprot:COSAG01_NODE_48595_length_379_cov_2.917857_1_plen_47_part_10
MCQHAPAGALLHTGEGGMLNRFPEGGQLSPASERRGGRDPQEPRQIR